jgi:hypothetical protein
MQIEPKKILRLVTVTGADDTISPYELVGIQRRFPYAEFGILLSGRYSLGEGNSRFPSQKWLIALGDIVREHKLNLCGHVCGSWARKFLVGRWKRSVAPFPEFARYQINTHAERHVLDTAAMSEVVRMLHVFGKKVIFQLDGNDGDHAARAAMLQCHPNISGLFDLSHGAGVLPSEWPKPIEGLHCGYAGGLSPRNVHEQLERIQEVATGETWIDAETHLRNWNNGFDLDKVECFLQAAMPWVIE